MLNVHIIGTGGLAKELISYIKDEEYPRYRIVGAWGEENFNNSHYQHLYKGTIEHFNEFVKGTKPANINAMLAIANPTDRRAIYSYEIEDSCFINWVNYIHPTCVVSQDAFIGKGNIFSPYCVIPGDSSIHDFVYFNVGVNSGHDCEIQSYVTAFPKVNICGNTFIDYESIIGLGSYILPNVRLEPKTRVRAGSVVWKSPYKSGVLSGNPAVLVT